jgi:hypothetical protein
VQRGWVYEERGGSGVISVGGCLEGSIGGCECGQRGVGPCLGACVNVVEVGVIPKELTA